MINVKKVIKGLECCVDLQRGNTNRNCEECPYNDDVRTGTCKTLYPLLADALSLLYAQEPRVLEIDEIYAYDKPVVLEQPYESEECQDSYRFVNLIQPLVGKPIVVLTNPEWESAHYSEEYGKTWRCWTAKPTDEQRKATLWEA